MPPIYDWKVSKENGLTKLEITDLNRQPLAIGTGPDIWAAREDALANTNDVGVQNYITARIFPAAD